MKILYVHYCIKYLAKQNVFYNVKIVVKVI